MAPLSLWTCLGIIVAGGALLWWLAGRTTGDRRLHWIVLGSYALRVALGLALFAIAFWGWPILKPLQIRGGFWIFGLDGRAYHHIAAEIAAAWATGIELPRLETAIEYFAVVASVYRVLGPHPLYPILMNGWCGAVLGILAYRIANTLAGRRAALLSALLVSCWPSSFLWSAQLLKDALSWCLIFTALWLVVWAIQEERSGPRRWLRWIVGCVTLIGVLIVLTRLRFYLGSAFRLAALAVLLPMGLWAWLRRRDGVGARTVGVVGLVVGSVLVAGTLNVTKLLSPAHPDVAHYKLGLMFWKEAQPTRAMSEFREAIARNPAYRDAYLGLGAVAAQQDDWEDAVWAYTRSLPHVSPERTGTIHRLIARLYLEMGHQYLQAGDAEAATASYGQALSHDPSLMDAKVNLGLALAYAEDFDPAFVIFSQVLREANDAHQQALVRKGLVQLYAALARRDVRRRGTEPAIAAYVASLHLDPQPLEFAECGLLLAEADEVDDALAMGLRAFPLEATDPSTHTIRSLVAQLYLAKARHEIRYGHARAAVPCYEEALRLDAHLSGAAEELRDLRHQLYLSSLVPGAQPPLSPEPLSPESLSSEPPILQAPPAAVMPMVHRDAQEPPILQAPPAAVMPIVHRDAQEPPVADLAVTLFTSTAGWSDERLTRSRQRRQELAQLHAYALQMRDQALAGAYEMTPEALGVRRDGFVRSGGYSLMDVWAQISTPQKMLTYLPRALLIGLLAPFPPQWFDTRGSTGVMRLFAGMEMLLLYLLLPAMGWGLWGLLRRRRPSDLFFLTFLLTTLVPIALVVANIGTLFRLRLLFLLPLLVVAACGEPEAVYQRMAGWASRFFRHRGGRAAGSAATLADGGSNGGPSPSVSVVIPAHNAQATVSAAIRSALHQSHAPFEVIVVDDGSTDDTVPRVQRFGGRVRCVRQEHGGPGAARNRGAREAQGEFLAFLDADDLWLPQKLERQLAMVRRQPRLEAVQGSAYLVNDALEILETRRCRPQHDTLLDILLFRNLPAFSSTLLVRKAVFETVGGFPTDVSEEAWETACRLSRRGTMRSLAEPLVLYRQHPGNRSHSRMDMAMFQDSGFRCLNRLFGDPALPASVRRREAQIWARFFIMLAGGHLHRRQWRESLQWILRALILSPLVIGYVIGLPLRGLQRGWTARRKRSLIHELT